MMEKCERCAWMRPVVQVDRKDPATGKTWTITKCLKCTFNITLEEKASGLDNIQKPGRKATGKTVHFWSESSYFDDGPHDI